MMRVPPQRLIPLALLGLLAMSGCSQPLPQVSTSTEPTPTDDAPVSIPDELRAASVVAMASSQPGSGLLVGDAPSGGTLLGWMDPASGWIVSDPSAMTGRPYLTHADGTGDGVQVVMSYVPATGGSAATTGWMSWAELKDGRWTWDENPPRWSRCTGYGIANWQGDTYVLNSCITGWSLSRRSGNAWTSEPVTGLATFGAFTLVSNETALFIVGQSAQGDVVLLSRTAANQAFASTVLQPASGVALGSITAFASARADEPPVAAWWHNALPTGAGPEPVRTFAATFKEGHWTVSTVDEAMHTPLATAADSNGSFVMTRDQQTGQPDTLWRYDGTSWASCPSLSGDDVQVSSQGLVSEPSGAHLVYSTGEQLRHVALDAGLGTCT